MPAQTHKARSRSRENERSGHESRGQQGRSQSELSREEEDYDSLTSAGRDWQPSEGRSQQVGRSRPFQERREHEDDFGLENERGTGGSSRRDQGKSRSNY